MWRTILREISGHSKKEGIHNQANYISSLMRKKSKTEKTPDLTWPILIYFVTF